jgi:RNA-splicing ligase RtcB
MHYALERLDANRLRIRTPANLDIVLYANEQVYLDAASVDEIRAFAVYPLAPPGRRAWERALLEEAPSRYKDVTPVIETVVDGDIASKVARLWPLLTIKGP